MQITEKFVNMSSNTTIVKIYSIEKRNTKSGGTRCAEVVLIKKYVYGSSNVVFFLLRCGLRGCQRLKRSD